MSGNSMEGMSMSEGTLDPRYLQKVYWTIIGTAIGIAAIANILDQVLLLHRTTGEPKNRPAMPKTLCAKSHATMTAIVREISEAEIVPSRWRSNILSSARLGRVILVLANMAVVLVLCFYDLDIRDQWQWQDIAYRTGYIGAAQVPLVVLLAGKRNIIAFFVGSSYEKLNWLHRWVARILFVTATIHMGFWFRSWSRYHYIAQKLQADSIARRGLVAWCILLWIVLSSFAPLRHRYYEAFLIQHIITFVGFLVAVSLHLSKDVKVYVWIPIGIYVFDRAARWLRIILINLTIFHPKLRGQGLFTCQARLAPEHGGTFSMVVKSPPIKWKAGQHVFLSCPSIALLQSHPFTIASLPEDGAMHFLIKSRNGATKIFHTQATDFQTLPLSSNEYDGRKGLTVIIDGPYGNMRPLRQFDSVMLIAGGCGATFTVPLLRDLVNGLKDSGQNLRFRRSCLRRVCDPARYVHFVWIIKSRQEYKWFASQLSQVVEDTKLIHTDVRGISVTISIYITSDAAFESIAPVSSRSNSTSSRIKHPLSETVKVDSKTARQEVSDASHNLRNDDGASPVRIISSIVGKTNSVESQQGRYCVEEPFPPMLPDVDRRKEIPPAAIGIHAGRPRCNSQIREFLEQARGESAVVVCGPQGLRDDVRRRVVALSDERAIHKGTGAQGAYFWEEGFGY